MIDPDSGVSLSKFSPESPKPAGACLWLAFSLPGNTPVGCTIDGTNCAISY